MNYDVKIFDSKDLLTIAAISAIVILLFSFSAKYSGWQTIVDDIITFINENKIFEKLKSTLYMELITNGKNSFGLVKYISAVNFKLIEVV